MIVRLRAIITFIIIIIIIIVVSAADAAIGFIVKKGNLYTNNCPYFSPSIFINVKETVNGEATTNDVLIRCTMGDYLPAAAAYFALSKILHSAPFLAAHYSKHTRHNSMCPWLHLQRCSQNHSC
jgi:hypothetical protein